MNRAECVKALNEFQVLFPNYYRNTDRDYLQRVVDSWTRKYSDLKYDDVIEAMYQYDKESDYTSAPSTKTIRAIAVKIRNQRQEKANGKHKRIVTPEEDCWMEYKQLMTKGKYMTMDDINRAKALQKYALLFEGEGWEQRYIRHFGKPRKEFERYD